MQEIKFTLTPMFFERTRVKPPWKSKSVVAVLAGRSKLFGLASRVYAARGDVEESSFEGEGEVVP